MHHRFNFETLIANAQNALSAIEAHPDFKEIVKSEQWDDPAIALDDAKQLVSDLERIHSEYFERRYRQFTQTYEFINLGQLESFNGC